jgi:dethiobiotin synthetase
VTGPVSAGPVRAVRPRRLVVVAGTATEVGKTWVACALIRELRTRGLTVAARKPAQSFLPGDATTDADELAAATGEDPVSVCPAHRRYEVPMAPPMAAAALGREPIRLAELVDETTASWPDRAVDVGLVELAGGVRSPLADDGDGVALAAALGPDLVLVVADAGLGTINSVRMTVDALAGPTPVVVHLNRFDRGVDLHRRNHEWLVERDGTWVTTTIGALADAARASGGR